MEYIWTEKDVICGRIVCKVPHDNFKVDGWTAKWTFKIGFDATKKPAEGRYLLLAMTDGMVCKQSMN